MLTTPSPLGVSGRAVRVSLPSYHYLGSAMLTTPSSLGVSGRAVRVSLPSYHYPGPGLTRSNAHIAELVGGNRPGGTCQCLYPGWAIHTTLSLLGTSGRAVRESLSSYHYPGPGLSHAHYAEPAGGKRPGGTCQSSFVPLPGQRHAHYAEFVGGKRPGGTCQCLYPGWIIDTTPSLLGVNGWAVRVSLPSYHYLG
jgi:hypothetical protein